MCQQQLVQLHENLEQFRDLGVNLYIVSADQPAQQKELYNALAESYDDVVTFIADPELVLIDNMGMKNNEVAYRGYAILDQEGNVVLTKQNDHWGEQLDQTFEDISEELQNIK
ncbi:redoxin domain-containing protein [Bacillus sp. AK128]